MSQLRRGAGPAWRGPALLILVAGLLGPAGCAHGSAPGTPPASHSAGPPSAGSPSAGSPSAGSPLAGSPAAPCRSPGEAVLPGSDGSLDETSSGTYCLSVGQRIDVFLHGSATARWNGIADSRPDVLRPERTGVLTAPVGVTPGIFRAAGPGTTLLSSSTPDGRSWAVTVVIR